MILQYNNNKEKIAYRNIDSATYAIQNAKTWFAFSLSWILFAKELSNIAIPLIVVNIFGVSRSVLGFSEAIRNVMILVMALILTWVTHREQANETRENITADGTGAGLKTKKQWSTSTSHQQSLDNVEGHKENKTSHILDSIYPWLRYIDYVSIAKILIVSAVIVVLALLYTNYAYTATVWYRWLVTGTTVLVFILIGISEGVLRGHEVYLANEIQEMEESVIALRSQRHHNREAKRLIGDVLFMRQIGDALGLAAGTVLLSVLGVQRTFFVSALFILTIYGVTKIALQAISTATKSVQTLLADKGNRKILRAYSEWKRGVSAMRDENASVVIADDAIAEHLEAKAPSNTDNTDTQNHATEGEKKRLTRLEHSHNDKSFWKFVTLAMIPDWLATWAEASIFPFLIVIAKNDLHFNYFSSGMLVTGSMLFTLAGTISAGRLRVSARTLAFIGRIIEVLGSVGALYFWDKNPVAVALSLLVLGFGVSFAWIPTMGYISDDTKSPRLKKVLNRIITTSWVPSFVVGSWLSGIVQTHMGVLAMFKMVVVLTILAIITQPLSIMWSKRLQQFK